MFHTFFSFLISLLIVTGHYGGSITHGEGFLFPDSDEEFSNQRIDPGKANVFTDLVMPIAKDKCNRCHNSKKKKGDLLLTALEGWKKGGKNGLLLKVGDRENSLMYHRLHLPMDEKKHMPPSGKKQLTKEELEFMDWWIASVKTFEETVEDLSPPMSIMDYIHAQLKVVENNLPMISDEDIQNLAQDGVPIQRLSEESPWLSLEYENGMNIKSSHLKKVMKYKENIRKIDASKSGVRDNDLKRINEFVNLVSLNLSSNTITSKGLAHLTQLDKLETLNLYGTAVDNEVLELLSNFTGLKSIYLSESKVDMNQKDLQAKFDHINLYTGPDLTIFEGARVLPPSFETTQDIFQDSILVALNHFSSSQPQPQRKSERPLPRTAQAPGNHRRHGQYHGETAKPSPRDGAKGRLQLTDRFIQIRLLNQDRHELRQMPQARAQQRAQHADRCGHQRRPEHRGPCFAPRCRAAQRPADEPDNARENVEGGCPQDEHADQPQRDVQRQLVLGHRGRSDHQRQRTGEKEDHVRQQDEEDQPRFAGLLVDQCPGTGAHVRPGADNPLVQRHCPGFFRFLGNLDVAEMDVRKDAGLRFHRVFCRHVAHPSRHGPQWIAKVRKNATVLAS